MRCAYRGVDGCKCAVGHLIADEEYRPEMEGTCLDSYEIISEADGDLLSRLRVMHDTCRDSHFLEDLERKAKVVAESFDLCL